MINLVGQLYNEDSTECTNGVINILGSTGVALHHTDENGRYAFELPYGEYSISVPIGDRFFSGTVTIDDRVPEELSIFLLIQEYGTVTQTPH